MMIHQKQSVSLKYAKNTCLHQIRQIKNLELIKLNKVVRYKIIIQKVIIFEYLSKNQRIYKIREYVKMSSLQNNKIYKACKISLFKIKTHMQKSIGHKWRTLKKTQVSGNTWIIPIVEIPYYRDITSNVVIYKIFHKPDKTPWDLYHCIRHVNLKIGLTKWRVREI